VLSFFIKYNLDIQKLGNVTDFGYKCRNCNTINRITIEDGELKKHG
jgi:hypothetical protein